MDRKNINSSENKYFCFQLRPYQVILRIALVSITMVLLTWRLIDFGDEFLNSEIHMSTPAGTLTGATALLLQTAIIMGLALIAWWIFRRSYAPPQVRAQKVANKMCDRKGEQPKLAVLRRLNVS